MKFDKKILDYLEPVEIYNQEAVNNVEFTGITEDSRKVSKGYIFVCLIGERVDGHHYIQQAVDNGASLIITQKEPNKDLCSSLPCIRVKNTKLAISRLAAIFNDFPAKKMDLVGITGTNGKTTVSHIIEHIFEKAGTDCAIIGTLGCRFSSKEDYISGDHTTPQPVELQKSLKNIADKGIKKSVMEVSSHSLDQHRVAECKFSGAVFTNLTQDHLDYHITMENYFKAKAKLLNQLKEGSYTIINTDDTYFRRLLELISNKHSDIKNIKILTYGIDYRADISAKNIVFSADGTEFLCETPLGSKEVKLKLSGQFNVYNVLAAIGAGIAEGISLDTCIEAVELISGIPGRFEVVSAKPLVIVDYAHTPNGLENVLNAAKELVPDNGSLVCVFGCGGDRDVTKRPQMGKIAEDYSDKIIITSDNPRTEDPQQIITDILTGIRELDSKKILVEPDRTVAIEQAIINSCKQDVIVIAGKGHEDYQIINDKKFHFDDKEEALKALQKIKS